MVVVHVFRKLNRIADWLAKRAARQGCEEIVLQTPTSDLMKLLAEDARGERFPRRIAGLEVM